MKHQRFYEYQQHPGDVWNSVSADELLFTIIPSGDFFCYRLHIVNLESTEETEKTDAINS